VAAAENQGIVEELRALAAEVRGDLESQERELGELSVLIRQTTAEIDRIGPVRNEAAKRIREMEGNIEHFSRTEIAQSYGASAEAQMRLFMMESQLEQLQHKQRALERNRRNLLRFAGLVDQLPAAPSESDAAASEVASSPRQVISRVVQAEEAERQRCAQAIHDGAAQWLANMVIRAQLCQRLLDSDEARARQEIQGLSESMATSLQEVRRLIYDLRPLVLEDVGLQAAIQKYVQAAADRATVPIELKMSGVEQRLDTWAEVALFRLVQEALSNALRHAQATRIQVAVDFEGDAFRALVEDDGVGFEPPRSVRVARQSKRLGLAAMLERAALLGGSVTFDSAPGRGARVRVEVPLPPGGGPGEAKLAP